MDQELNSYHCVPRSGTDERRPSQHQPLCARHTAFRTEQGTRKEQALSPACIAPRWIDHGSGTKGKQQQRPASFHRQSASNLSNAEQGDDMIAARLTSLLLPSPPFPGTSLGKWMPFKPAARFCLSSLAAHAFLTWRRDASEGRPAVRVRQQAWRLAKVLRPARSR